MHTHLQFASLMYLKLMFPFHEHLCRLNEYAALTEFLKDITEAETNLSFKLMQIIFFAVVLQS